MKHIPCFALVECNYPEDLLFHLLFSENGEVFALGENSKGQLGLGNLKRLPQGIPFQRVPGMEGQMIIKVACSQEFGSAAVSQGDEFLNIKWKFIPKFFFYRWLFLCLG